MNQLMEKLYVQKYSINGRLLYVRIFMLKQDGKYFIDACDLVRGRYR